MITKKDIEIISHFRNNARKKITQISREMKIPVTTIYDKLRVHEKKFIKKHTTLLDFLKLGLYAKAHILIKPNKLSRNGLHKSLMENPNVNSLCKVNFGSDYLAEVIFKSAADVENFVEELEQMYDVGQAQVFNVIEELKKEEFLTKPEHLILA